MSKYTQCSIEDRYAGLPVCLGAWSLFSPPPLEQTCGVLLHKMGYAFIVSTWSKRPALGVF